jgi:hypothetical protein
VLTRRGFCVSSAKSEAFTAEGAQHAEQFQEGFCAFRGFRGERLVQVSFFIVPV